jgi:ASC-1-like (ASCH) protein
MNSENQVISFDMGIKNPWYSKIKRKEKVLEGRKAGGSWSFIKVGMFGYITCGSESILVKVTKINYYDTLEEYLITETVARCLPGIETLEEAKSIYCRFQIDAELLKTMNEEEVKVAEVKAEKIINSSRVQAIYLELC